MVNKKTGKRTKGHCNSDRYFAGANFSTLNALIGRDSKKNKF